MKTPKTQKRLQCPKCRAKGLRTLFTVQVNNPDSPEGWGAYESKFRLVCKRCGFAGYSVPHNNPSWLNESWNEAVLDYLADI